MKGKQSQSEVKSKVNTMGNRNAKEIKFRCKKSGITDT